MNGWRRAAGNVASERSGRHAALTCRGREAECAGWVDGAACCRGVDSNLRRCAHRRDRARRLGCFDQSLSREFLERPVKVSSKLCRILLGVEFEKPVADLLRLTLAVDHE